MGNWDRDLGVDLDQVKVWRAGVVVTLVENHEIRELRGQARPVEVQKRNMAWLLVETGHEPDEAIAPVRAVRPKALETADQQAYVGH